VSVTGFVGALIAAFVLGIVNAILRRSSFCSRCRSKSSRSAVHIRNHGVSFGGSVSESRLVVNGFWPAFWGAIVLGIVSFVLSSLLRAPIRKLPSSWSASSS